jgi:hypothetical protein
VISPFAGVIGDRVNRRKLLIAVLALMALQSRLLAVLTGSGLITRRCSRASCSGGHLQRVRDADAPVDLRADARPAARTCRTRSRSTRC